MSGPSCGRPGSPEKEQLICPSRYQFIEMRRLAPAFPAPQTGMGLLRKWFGHPSKKVRVAGYIALYPLNQFAPILGCAPATMSTQDILTHLQSLFVRSLPPLIELLRLFLFSTSILAPPPYTFRHSCLCSLIKILAWLTRDRIVINPQAGQLNPRGSKR